MKNLKTKNQSKEIAITILKGIGLVGLVATVMVFPGLALVIREFEKETGYNRRQVRNSIYSLRKRKLIALKQTKRGVSLVLTPKGGKRLLQVSLKELKLDKQAAWDGKWRLVTFDIPESLKTTRDKIRKRLYDLGFVQVHKSVFIVPYPCKEAVNLLRDYYELPAGTLYVFESKVLESESELKKIFKLK